MDVDLIQSNCKQDVSLIVKTEMDVDPIQSNSKQNVSLINAVISLLKIGIRNSLVPKILLHCSSDDFRITESFVQQVGNANGCSIPRRGTHLVSPIKSRMDRIEATVFLCKYRAIREGQPDSPEWEVFVSAFSLYHRIVSKHRDPLCAEACWSLVKRFTHRDPDLFLKVCSDQHIVVVARGELPSNECPICQKMHKITRKTARVDVFPTEDPVIQEREIEKQRN